MSLFVASLILTLLIIGGVEINPGPTTPTTQLVPDKQGKFDIIQYSSLYIILFIFLK